MFKEIQPKRRLKHITVFCEAIDGMFDVQREIEAYCILSEMRYEISC